MAGDYIEIELKDSAGGEAHEGFLVGLTDSFALLEVFEAWTGLSGFTALIVTDAVERFRAGGGVISTRGS